MPRITVLELASLAGGQGREATGAEQRCYEPIDVLVQIELKEEGAHDPSTRGSIRSSAMRFRSIC
jgi:hypothetical protein